jgi:hypothetical protein
MVEFRGWWIVLDTVWILILIVFGMGVFGAWPPSPWGVIFIAGSCSRVSSNSGLG